MKFSTLIKIRNYMYYSLEKHLASFTDKEYQLLNSIWLLNKQQLPLAQQNINTTFPHYSIHDQSHADTIIKNIESFLGKDRIANLSPTDTFLILMAASTHDLGMVVFYNTIEKNWPGEEFQAYLKDLSKNSADEDLSKSASLLLSIEPGALKASQNNKNLPLLIRNAITLVVAEFYRRSHHKRSNNILNGTDTEFHELLQKFYMAGIPQRFSYLLGEIAYGHGINFYEVIDRLEFQANGISNDLMHPRFVAFLLRLGDLLDVDDKRFNMFSAKVFSGSLPHTSGLHKQKHASLKHLLISPTSIEVTVDCKNDEVYRIARGWFDWLQIEVQNQSREWSQIAPKEMNGFPPIISKGKVKVLYNSAEPKEELLNLRFSISQKNIFEILEGGSIYQEPGLVFLRGLVQNSWDAIKIQLWKNLTSGVYNFMIKDINS